MGTRVRSFEVRSQFVLMGTRVGRSFQVGCKLFLMETRVGRSFPVGTRVDDENLSENGSGLIL
jgi:hypothetical protein